MIILCLFLLGRFGRTILELGGNNAVVVMDDANLEVALRSVLFAAAGKTYNYKLA